MVSSYTSRSRLLKQATGDNTNTWGDQQSTGDFDSVDFALDGWVAVDPTGGVTLTTANGSNSATLNQAGGRQLKLTTATATATTTLAAVEHWYLVWNATTASQTIACAGGGTTVSILAGEIVFVMCDATNVKRLTPLTTPGLDLQGARITSLGTPTANTDAATKQYADNLAFTANAGVLPGQTGNVGKFLTTDGTTASWSSITTANVTDYVTDQTSRQATTLSQAKAFAVAFSVAL